MIVNDMPGEGCRIAIIRDHYLEDLYEEHIATATNVGNIYKGRVTNVEPAIQAAFVDFGESQSGFLHISDLHPRYFPGEEQTERVGKKIPRRDRPLIQNALKRGDEVLVQVLKEGIGSKGPTLTSYPSIPGRLLVCMPYMGRIGVSRKVEDETVRRKMRQTLESLDLDSRFGFILRTAGIDKTKTELKRDVAYLMRLWKVMEKRIEKVSAPCELYRESDLLIRTVRDVLRPSIEAVIVDTESAADRITAFLKVAAPRTAPKVIRYHDPAPIFHCFDVERQIDLIHSREVPLPSGGSLVIDQAEALVAIDVNSGRSRSSRDSETNALNTNLEAVDEICRQLRLRDLGGLIIHDLIDMWKHGNRRKVEDRFRSNLTKDRAKTTILRISEFGLVEMTRQRMRPSLRKTHFGPCSHCQGRGELKSPFSVASDAIRHLQNLLQHDRVQRLELVVSPQVASVLLSRKRKELVHIEERSHKTIDVRVSDTIAGDRVDYYGYDNRNSDVDISRLPKRKPPTIEQLLKAEIKFSERGEVDEVKTPRRRRRRRKTEVADASAIALQGDFIETEEEGTKTADPDSTSEEIKKPRRRRRRKSTTDQSMETSSNAPQQDRVKESRDQKNRKTNDTSNSKPTPPSPDSAPPIRIHQLAKEIGVASKEVVTRCREKGMVAVKGHQSSVNAEDASTIRAWFAPEQTPESQIKSSPQEEKQKAEAEPGQRRRRGRKRRPPAEQPQKSTTDSSPEPTKKTGRIRKPRTPVNKVGAESKTNSSPGTRKRRIRGKKTPKTTPAVIETPATTENNSPSTHSEPAPKRGLYRNRRTRPQTLTPDVKQQEEIMKG